MDRIMKNTLNKIGLLLVLALLMVSCSKDDSSSDDSEVFFRCKINGKLHEFNHSLSANDKPDDWNTIHFVTVGGRESKDMASPGFGFQLVSDEGAKETTYVAANGEGPELIGQYYVQNVVDGKIVSTTGYRGDGNDGSSFTLSITSLTKWGVKGTFSGVLEGDDVFLTVTEGEFSAPYNKN